MPPIDYSRWDALSDEESVSEEESSARMEVPAPPRLEPRPVAHPNSQEAPVVRVDWDAGAVLASGSYCFLDEYAAVKHRLLPPRPPAATEAGVVELAGAFGVPPAIRFERSPGLAGRHAVTTRAALPGELLLSCPGIAVVKSTHAGRICAHCFEAFTAAGGRHRRRCCGCGTVSYCSGACEAADAAGDHSEAACAALATLAEAAPQLPFALDLDTARLAVVVLATTQPPGPDSAGGGDSGAGEGSSDDDATPKADSRAPLIYPPRLSLPLDLVSHAAAVGPEEARAAAVGGAVLQRLLLGRPGTAQEESLAAELLLQLRFNAHDVDSLFPEGDGPEGGGGGGSGGGAPLAGALLGLFPTGAYLNHSCTPTASLAWHRMLGKPAAASGGGRAPPAAGRAAGPAAARARGSSLVLEVRAACALAPGAEVTFSYLAPQQLAGGRRGRRELLRAAFLFDCCCARCRREARANVAARGASRAVRAAARAARAAVDSAMREVHALGPGAAPRAGLVDGLLHLLRGEAAADYAQRSESALTGRGTAGPGNEDDATVNHIKAYDDHEVLDEDAGKGADGYDDGGGGGGDDDGSVWSDAAACALVGARLAGDHAAVGAAAAWAAARWVTGLGQPLAAARGDLLLAYAHAHAQRKDPASRPSSAASSSAAALASAAAAAAAEEAAAEGLSVLCLALGPHHPRVAHLRRSLPASLYRPAMRKAGVTQAES